MLQGICAILFSILIAVWGIALIGDNKQDKKEGK